MGETYNGRVNIMDAKNLTTHRLFNETEIRTDDFKHSAIKNIHSENPLSTLYFSSENIDILQNGVRYSVYKKSNNQFIIGIQSMNDLMIIMRSIYLQYAQNLPYNIIEQTKDLNSKVLDYTVPTILRELNQFIHYKKDISKLPMPMEHAENVSMKGTKVLYSQEY
jgi:hypothetical protein